MADFEVLTPDEFSAVFDGWKQAKEVYDRGAWERSRLVCLCLLQPYSKKPLAPRAIMEFPWEKDKDSCQEQQNGEPEKTFDQRFAEAKKKYGLK